MADNVSVDVVNTGLPAGTLIAADEIAGVKYQRIKLIYGPDGTNSGDVDTANGLPVKHQGPISLTGSVAVTMTGPISLTGSVAVTLTGPVSLTGSVQISGITNPISLTGSVQVSIQSSVPLSLTGSIQVSGITAPISLTGSVQVSVQSVVVPISLTGSIQITGITNAVTVSPHLVSITGSVQITGITNPISLTGSVQVAITSSVVLSLTGSVQVTGITNPISLTGSVQVTVQNTTLTVEMRFPAPATSKLTRGSFQYSVTGSCTIVAGVGAQTIRIHRLLMTIASATTLTFESSTSALSGLMSFGTNGSLVLDNDGEPWYVCSTADPFRGHQTTTGVKIAGTVWYTQS